jgi:hypothetical protein
VSALDAKRTRASGELRSRRAFILDRKPPAVVSRYFHGSFPQRRACGRGGRERERERDFGNGHGREVDV